jgi:hypothetical protein
VLPTFPFIPNSQSKVHEVVLNMQHLPTIRGFKMNNPTITSEKKIQLKAIESLIAVR